MKTKGWVIYIFLLLLFALGIAFSVWQYIEGFYKPKMLVCNKTEYILQRCEKEKYALSEKNIILEDKTKLLENDNVILTNELRQLQKELAQLQLELQKYKAAEMSLDTIQILDVIIDFEDDIYNYSIQFVQNDQSFEFIKARVIIAVKGSKKEEKQTITKAQHDLYFKFFQKITGELQFAEDFNPEVLQVRVLDVQDNILLNKEFIWRDLINKS